MEKITKEEFLKRFNEADIAGIVLDDNRKMLNSKNIAEIKVGDYYEKNGHQHVVVSVDDDYVELNDNAALELVMDYMQKRMDQIDETRRSFKAQYPDLLP